MHPSAHPPHVDLSLRAQGVRLTLGFADPPAHRRPPEHAPAGGEQAGQLVQGAAQRSGVWGAVGGRGGGAGGGGLPGLPSGRLPGGIRGFGEGAAGRARRG